MAIDYVRGGSPRCPSLLLGGLILICIFLACSWWSLTSQNFELLNQISNLEEQIKISGDELDKCLSTKTTLEEKLKNLQAGVAQSRVKFEQLQTQNDDLRETLNKAQESLEASKKNIASLESSLTYKSTELESLRTLDEAKNKTLEALRTEKKTLNVRLIEEKTKVETLQAELAGLKKKPADPVVAMIHRGPTQTDQEDAQEKGMAIDGSHGNLEAQEEIEPASKGDGAVEPIVEKPGENVDIREKLSTS